MHAVDHRYSETTTTTKTRECTDCIGTGAAIDGDAELIDCTRCDGTGAVKGR